MMIRGYEGGYCFGLGVHKWQKVENRSFRVKITQVIKFKKLFYYSKEMLVKYRRLYNAGDDNLL
jgi:hypothetical protein